MGDYGVFSAAVKELVKKLLDFTQNEFSVFVHKVKLFFRQFAEFPIAKVKPSFGNVCVAKVGRIAHVNSAHATVNDFLKVKFNLHARDTNRVQNHVKGYFVKNVSRDLI